MSISECEPIALATGSEYTDFSRLLADRQYATLANAIVSVGFTPKRPDTFDLFARVRSNDARPRLLPI